MTSILTNASATSALQTLRSINSGLQETQNHASSGLRVEKAADNAAYWSIATTMRSDVKAYSAVADGIGLAQSIVDTAYAAAETVRGLFSDIKALAVTALASPPGDLGPFPQYNFYYADYAAYDSSEVAKIDDDVNQKLAAAYSAIRGASFSGVNLLWRDKDGGSIKNGETISLTSGYANGQVQTTDFAIKDIVMLNDAWLDPDYQWDVSIPEEGILDGWEPIYGDNAGFIALAGFFAQEGWVGGRVEEDQFKQLEIYSQITRSDRKDIYDQYITILDGRIQKITDSMSQLGSLQTRLSLADDMNSRLIDDTRSGVGRLVDADMEEESSKLAAQQTQQNLALQTLSIANTAPQRILSLFHG